MRPRTLLLQQNQQLERLCDNVIHLRDAYRRNPNPTMLANIARNIHMPPSIFKNEIQRLTYDPGPDHWRGLMIDNTDLEYTPFTITIRHVGPTTIITGCPLPANTHCQYALLDMETSIHPRLTLY